MPMIPDVMHSADKIKAIHKSKNDDYALEADPFFNFKVQQYFMSLVKNEKDKVYACMLGLKFARIANLLNKGGETANNEPLEDSFIDLATYTLLWKAAVKENGKVTRPALAEKTANTV